MSVLVVVAEAEEIKLIPRAYKDLPVLVAGVGAKMLDTLLNIDPSVDVVVNVGYCGSKELPIGTIVYEPECETVDDFAEGENYPITEGKVLDMENRWLERWCNKHDVGLKVIKVVSDNLSYVQYKKTLKKGEVWDEK